MPETRCVVRSGAFRCVQVRLVRLCGNCAGVGKQTSVYGSVQNARAGIELIIVLTHWGQSDAGADGSAERAERCLIIPL